VEFFTLNSFNTIKDKDLCWPSTVHSCIISWWPIWGILYFTASPSPFHGLYESCQTAGKCLGNDGDCLAFQWNSPPRGFPWPWLSYGQNTWLIDPACLSLLLGNDRSVSQVHYGYSASLCHPGVFTFWPALRPKRWLSMETLPAIPKPHNQISALSSQFLWPKSGSQPSLLVLQYCLWWDQPGM
jgi:hypothetical protein